MKSFRMLKLTRSGFAVLESDGSEPAESELPLYANGKKAAVVVDTIASVAKPLYLAKTLAELKEGMTLTTRR